MTLASGLTLGTCVVGPSTSPFLTSQGMAQSQLSWPCGHNPSLSTFTCTSQSQQEGQECPKEKIMKQGGDGGVPGLILPLSVWLQLPYEKACKNKLFCVAELQLATTLSQ